ncbi:MAG: hypothetical protein EOP05_18220, partial [Proteobacteria bacterium]
MFRLKRVIKTCSASLAMVCAFAVSGCNYSIQKVPTSSNGNPGGSNQGAGANPGGGTNPVQTPGPIPVSDPALNFDNVFVTSIKTSCFGCHAAPRNASGINLETYESVFANRAAVEQAVSSRAMPDSMGRTMDDAARDLLLRWLA